MLKLIIFAFLSPFVLLAQVAKDYAVLVTATVEESPAKITLHWPQESVSSYYIYKKLKSDATYGSALATLAGTSTSYADTDVLLGEVYEYYIKRNGPTTAYGYINSGIKVAADENGLGSKGKLILLVDSSHSTSLSMEIDRLIDDLEGEGWTTLRHDVSPTSSVPTVRQIIQTEYNADKDHVKSVFILGHVPVPYSGRLNPDAHGNHIGAWPADGYYGDIDGNWTDFSVNDTSASDPRNRNVPGDGKFDQSLFPSPVELQVGRVDFSNMPSFSSSETELLRNYLNKNHAFRTKAFSAIPRALIDDNFGGFNGEAFASSGWKAFSTFFGPDSIKSNVGTSIDYRTDLNKDSYLWSYGCGAGSYTSCSGIGNTGQLAGDSLQSVFTMLFGSYFGDWDSKNNILRAPLAQGLTLTNVWSGRPHWSLHHMGMGENIGYSQLLMVNQNPYFQSYGARFVHIALMGDPTLTMYIVAPPSGLQLAENNNVVELNWTASPDNVLGYHVYRKDDAASVYNRVNENMIVGTSYIDTEFNKPSTYGYAVRAVKLEVTSSGSYYNLSTGAVGEIETVYTGIRSVESPLAFKVYPNPSNGVITLFTNAFPHDQYTLSLYSSMNKLVERSTILMEGSQQVEMDYSNLPSGLYVLRISSQRHTHSEKLILVR